MDNKDILLHFFEAENNRNWLDYINFLAPDIEWHLCGGKKGEEVIYGIENYMKRICSAYEGNTDSFSWESIYTSESNNRLAAVLINSQGQRSIDIFEFNNGFICKEWEFLLG